MSAAIVQQPLPLFQEGSRFWEELIVECRRLTGAMNQAIAAGGLSPEHLIRCEVQEDIHLFKNGMPSTHVNVHLNFRSWGPVLCIVIGGQQGFNRKFSGSELEIPVACDLDGSVIAIYDEGRSLSAHELTRFLMQSFRRCFRDVSLPC